VRSLPIIDDALLSRGERYFVAFRAVVDIKELGGPLAMIRFLWNDWRVAGEWVQWRLDAETLGSRHAAGRRAGPARAALLFLVIHGGERDRFGELYNWIFLLNLAGASILLALIISNLVRLVREYRSQVPGSRLASRMVAIFVGLAVLPLGLVYYFSVQFISRGIDTWFDVNVEAGLRDALDLSRATLESRMREHLEATRQVAESLARPPGPQSW
jgi:hypothetical protein